MEPYADQPYYVGFKVEGQDVGLDPRGHDQGMTALIATAKGADDKVIGLSQSA